MKTIVKPIIILVVSIITLVSAVNNYAKFNNKSTNTTISNDSSEKSSSKLQNQQSTYEKVLKNGLKVIVREDHRAPVIISQVWYRVGSSYESNGITGISHMLEHMMFKASKNLKDGEFTEIITKEGGDQNAMTSNDFTAYYQLLSSDKLETSFRLEAERMQNLLLDPLVFEKERQVVIEERRMRTEDNPVSNTYERLNAIANIGSPYHHPVIGWPDDLKRYTVEDLKAWYNKYYSPNNAIIIVVGDIKPTDVFSLAEKYFGDARSKDIQKIKEKSEVSPKGLRTLDVKLPAVRLPHLFMAYNVPSLNTADNKEDAYALDVMSYLLSGGKSSRLNKVLERKYELVTYISSSYDSFNLYNSLFTISAVPADGKSLGEVELAIEAQLEQLKNTLVTYDELARVKALLLANKVYEQDSIYYQAMVMGVLESINLSWRDYDNYIKKLQSITPEQVQQTARKYFIKDRLTIATLKPEDRS